MLLINDIFKLKSVGSSNYSSLDKSRNTGKNQDTINVGLVRSYNICPENKSLTLPELWVVIQTELFSSTGYLLEDITRTSSKDEEWGRW